MKSQEDILWNELFGLFEQLLEYSIFHCKTDDNLDLEIYETIRRIGEIKNIRNTEVSPDLLERLIYVNLKIKEVLNSEFNSLKYYSQQTEERIKNLTDQLRKGKLSQDEIDCIIDNLSLHMYKLKYLNQ